MYKRIINPESECPTIVLGLSVASVERMIAGVPIEFDLSDLGLRDQPVAIRYQRAGSRRVATEEIDTFVILVDDEAIDRMSRRLAHDVNVGPYQFALFVGQGEYAIERQIQKCGLAGPRVFDRRVPAQARRDSRRLST